MRDIPEAHRFFTYISSGPDSRHISPTYFITTNIGISFMGQKEARKPASCDPALSRRVTAFSSSNWVICFTVGFYIASQRAAGGICTSSSARYSFSHVELPSLSSAPESLANWSYANRQELYFKHTSNETDDRFGLFDSESYSAL